MIEIYICVNVLPLFFVISNASYKVRDRKMSIRTFILACLFPLPTITIYHIGSRIKRILETSKRHSIDESVMLEEAHLESINHMNWEIETESELSIGAENIDLFFEDPDIDIASEYSTDLGKVQTSKSRECDTQKGSESKARDDVSEEINLEDSRIEVTKALVDHYKVIKMFGFRFTWIAVHKLYRLVLVASNMYT